MKNDKLEKMLDETFDSSLKYALRNSNNDSCVQERKNKKITYRLKRMSDNLGIRIVDNRANRTTQNFEGIAHEDAFYRVSFREVCYVSHQGQEAGTVLGVNFYTDLMFVGNKLLSCSVVANFVKNENYDEPHDSLRPSVDVSWKIRKDGNFGFSLGCSSFSNDNYHEIRKYASALALVEKVIVPKMKSITDGIWNISRITIGKDI